MRKQVGRLFLVRKIVCMMLALLVVLPLAKIGIAFSEETEAASSGSTSTAWVSWDVYQKYHQNPPAFTYDIYNKNGVKTNGSGSYVQGVGNENSVLVGGNERSRKSDGTWLDNDPRDFTQILPYGTVSIDTSKLYDFQEKWRKNGNSYYEAYYFQTGTIITIRDTDNFKMFETTLKDGVSVVDGDGKPISTIKNFYNGTSNSEEQKIGYVGDLNADGTAKDIENPDGIVSIRYVGAATLGDGRTGDLVINYTKISIQSKFNATGRQTITGKDSFGNNYNILGPLMLMDANMVYVDSVATDKVSGKIAFDGTAVVEEADKKLLPFGVKIDMNISVEVGGYSREDGTYQPGTPYDGTMLWGSNDLDVPNRYGNGTGTIYSEGMTVNSGAVSYAVKPKQNSTDKRNLLVMERVQGTTDDRTANGIRFYHTGETNDYATFDTGFATLVSTNGSTNLTWTGSRNARNYLMGTTIFNTGISYTVKQSITTDESNQGKLGENDPTFTPDENGEVNGGTVYMELYDLYSDTEKEGDPGFIETGTLIVPSGGSTTHVIKPNEGYFCDYVIIDGTKVAFPVDNLQKAGDTYTASGITFTKQANGTITFTISNYQANHTVHANFAKYIDIHVQKKWLADKESDRPKTVTIQLMKTTDKDGNPGDAGRSVTLSSDKDWEAIFQYCPCFENGKEIIYSVKEQGVDEAKYHVVYTGDQDNGFVVENKRLSPTKVEIVLELQKRLNDHPVSDFSFGLYDVNGEKLDTSTTDAAGHLTATLQDTIKAPGTYTYTIQELQDNNLKVEYDQYPVKVTVEVFKDENGNLDNKPIVYKKNGVVLNQRAEFNNTYDATGKAQFEAIKELSGRDWQDDDQFTFELTPLDGAPLRVMENNEIKDVTDGVLTAVATKASHKAVFQELVFIFDDMLKYDETIHDSVYQTDRQFRYKVREIPGEANKGLTYSENEEIITINVHASRSSETLKVTYLDSQGTYVDSVIAPEFKNVYRPASVTFAPKVKVRIVDDKEAELTDWKWGTTNSWSEKTFTTNLSGESTEPMPDTTSAGSTLTNPLQSFGDITFTSAGVYEYVIQQNVPGDQAHGPVDNNLFYDNEPHGLKVIVKDDYQGQLYVDSVSYDGVEVDPKDGFLLITNRVLPGAYTSIEAKKTVKGAPYMQGEFTFRLDEQLNQGQSAMGHDHVGINGENGVISFELYYYHDALFKTDDTSEKTIYYIMSEKDDGEPGWKYDTHQYHFRVKVSHNSEEDSATGTHKIEITAVEYSTDEVPTGGNPSEMNWVPYNNQNPVEFINEYTGTGSAALYAEKRITREWRESDTFQFSLTGKDGAPLRVRNEEGDLVPVTSLTGTATAENLLVNLGEIWFTMEDLLNEDQKTYAKEKDYSYVIHETAAGDLTDGTFQKDGFTYAADQEVAIHIENDELNGRIRVTFGDDQLDDQEMNPFINEYEAEGKRTVILGTYKQLNGRPWQAGDRFGMRLVPIHNDIGMELSRMPMPASDTMQVTYDSENFSGKTNTKAGYFGAIAFTAPGVYEYEVEEIIPATHSNNITYMDSKHRVTVTVPDDGYGGLGEPEVVYAQTGSATPAVFINTWTPPEETDPGTGNSFRFTFTKVWHGEVRDIDFRLYHPDGTVYHHGFKRMKISDSEYLYEAWLSTGGDYYVIEEPLDGYSISYANGAAHADVKDRVYNGGVITNSAIPKTGDSRNTLLWAGMLTAGLGMISLMIIRTHRKQKHLQE